MKTASCVIGLLLAFGLNAQAADAPAKAPKAAPDRDGAAAFVGPTSGFEDREEKLGRAMATVIKTLSDTQPYAHEMNDALVKSILNQIQFAKDRGLMSELVDHDVGTVMPMLLRTKKYIDETSNPELALVAMFDKTTCHYQLVEETISEPNRRIYRSPYKTVLDVTRRLEQFDMTEEWIHNNWTIPRYRIMAATMGVNLAISDWREDGMVIVEVLDQTVASN